MNYNVGQSVMYAEIAEGGNNRRFLLPNEEGITQRLLVLLDKYPELRLERTGEAQITTQLQPQAPHAVFSSFPIQVQYLCDAQLFNHPDISTGPLRVATLFIEQVRETSLPQMPVTQKEAVPVGGGSLPSDPKAAEIQAEADKQSAKDALRAKLAAKNSGANEAERPLTKTAPAEQSHVVATYDPVKHAIPGSMAADKIVLQKVMETHEMVTKLLAAQAVPSESVTGQDLAKWYYKSVTEVGHDATWEALASKIKDI